VRIATSLPAERLLGGGAALGAGEVDLSLKAWGRALVRRRVWQPIKLFGKTHRMDYTGDLGFSDASSPGPPIFSATGRARDAQFCFSQIALAVRGEWF